MIDEKNLIKYKYLIVEEEIKRNFDCLLSYMIKYPNKMGKYYYSLLFNLEEAIIYCSKKDKYLNILI
jgi:hypothetical protein